MTQRDVSGWLPNLLGPREIQSDGVALPSRGAINFKNGVASDNSAEDSTDVEVIIEGADIVGTVPTSKGGLGLDASASSGAAVLASGVASFVAAGTSGNVLTSNGTTWTSAPAAAATTPPGGSNDEIQTKNGSSFAGATNVKAGSGFISIGGDPGVVGLIRCDAHTDKTFIGFQHSDENDYAAIAVASGVVVVGNSTLNSRINGAGISLYGPSAGIQLFNTAGIGYAFEVRSGSLRATEPLLGGDSSPYASHGQVVVNITGNTTLTDSQYHTFVQRFTGSANATITYPAPSSDERAYTKIVDNAGTGELTISTGGSGTVVLTAGTSALLVFDNTVGVRTAVTGA